MRLILVRHAEAEAESPSTMGDFGRALTSHGREQAADTGGYLVEHSKKRRGKHVWTSPFVRAVQTAEELAAKLPHATVSVAETLGSGQSVNGQVKMCLALDPDQDAVLVGHEPLLSELGAELLSLRSLPFSFEKGACLILRKGKGKKGFGFVSYRAPFGKERDAL
jgi:phosphohistidine phosphatase